MTLPAIKRMYARIRQRLAPPVFAGDETKTRQAELTSLVIVTGTIFTALVFIGNLLGGRVPVPALILNLVLFGSCLLMYFTLRRGKVALAGIGFIVLNTIVLTAAIASLGTIRVASTAVYLLMVIISGLLFNRRGALLTAVFCSLIILGLIAAENMGLLPRPDYVVNITQWVTYTSLFCLGGILISFATRSIQRSLRHAEDELAERKRAEQKLRESEDLFKYIFDYSVVGKSITRLSGEVSVNAAFCSMLGYSPEEFSGRKWQEITHPDDIELTQRQIDTLLSGQGTSCRFTKRFIHKDGSVVWAELSSTLRRDQDGRPLYLVTTLVDITYRIKTEEKLRASEAQNRAIIDSVPDMLFRIRRDGLFLDYHAPAGAVLYAPLEVFLNQKLEDVMPAEVARTGMQAIEESLNSNHMVIFEYGLQVSGETRHYEDRILPLNSTEVLSVVRDITERRRAEEALREKTRELDRYFTTSLDLFCIAGTDGFFRRLNHQWERTLGYSLAELEGRRFLDLVHPDDMDATLDAMTRLDAQETILNFENRYRCKDGSYRWIEWRSTPAGNLIYAAARDITERKQMEQDLVTERRRLANIIRGTNAGTWEWNVQTGEIVVNERWAEIIGYTLAELMPVSIEMWTGFAHPDDLKRSDELLQKHFEGELDYYETEVRLRHKDGHWVWVLDRGKVATWTEDGEPLIMSGTHQDISQRKQAEEDLRASEKRYRSLFEQTHDAVFILDFKGQHLDANRRAADMLGYRLEEIRKMSVNDTSAESNQSQEILQQLLTGETVPLYERRFRKKDGQVFPAEVSVELVRDANGKPLHIQSVVRDISQRKQVEEDLRIANQKLQRQIRAVERLRDELHEQALHDSLTGLHNRRYLKEVLNQEVQRTKRSQQPLSIIVMDIDHFKIINDTYGHQVGDLMLKETARLIKTHARGYDFVCRYGGEEFLLILPGASTTDAFARADEIRQKCTTLSIPHNGEKLNVTISMGVATYPDHDTDVEKVIIKADQALYHSKNTGRNRVTTWKDNHLAPG